MCFKQGQQRDDASFCIEGQKIKKECGCTKLTLADNVPSGLTASLVKSVDIFKRKGTPNG